jgi:hypothetical protein
MAGTCRSPIEGDADGGEGLLEGNLLHELLLALRGKWREEGGAGRGGMDGRWGGGRIRKD